MGVAAPLEISRLGDGYRAARGRYGLTRMVRDEPGTGPPHEGSTSARFEHIVWPTTQPLDDSWWDSVAECLSPRGEAGVRPATEVVLYLRDNRWYTAARAQPPLSSTAHADVVHGGLPLSAWTVTPAPPAAPFLQVQAAIHPDHLRRQTASAAASALLEAAEQLLEFVRQLSDADAGPERQGSLDPVGDAIAACHLHSAPAQATEFRTAAGTEVFRDDDLHITRTPCRCGLIYLRAWRRLRGTSREYLIPAGAAEVAQLREAVRAAPDYSGAWHAAEGVLSEMAQRRPYIELTNPDRPDVVPQWQPPGVPFAFSWPPS